MTSLEQLHENTLRVVKAYKNSEKRLIDLLMQNDEIKAFKSLGYSSLHVYCTKALGLSDAVAYAMVQIARKSKVFPEIKELVQADKLSTANATLLTRVITPENKAELLDLGQTLSKRELEKEIKRIVPEAVTESRVTVVNEIYSQVKIFMTESTKNDLNFLKQFYSKIYKKNLSLSETIVAMALELRDRHDPVRVAQRNVKAQSTSNNAITTNHQKKQSTFAPGDKTTRVPISALLRHQLNLRDKARCTFCYTDGSQCTESRWLNFHHIVPVSQGGATTLENLATICFNHHAYVHEIAKRAKSKNPFNFYRSEK